MQPSINTRVPAYKFILAGIDYVLIVGAYLLSLWAAYGKGAFTPDAEIRTLPAFLCIALLWIIIFQFYSLYKQKVFLTRSTQFIQLLRGISVGTMLLIFISFAAQSRYVVQSRLVVLLVWSLNLVLLNIGRQIYRYYYHQWVRLHCPQRPALIVGTGQKARSLAQRLLDDVSWGIHPVGFINPVFATSPSCEDKSLPHPCLGTMLDLHELVKRFQITDLFIAIDDISYEELLNLMETCKRTGVQVHVSSNRFRVLADKLDIEEIAGYPVTQLQSAQIPYSLHFKRFVDLILGSALLLISLPVMAVIAIAIKITSEGPALFKQERLGQNARPFTCYKFRTMYVNSDDRIHREYLANLIQGRVDDGEAGVYKLKNDPRVTKVGRILRKLSLDELPQLFNVLKGDMSLVGPRPPIRYEYEQYEEWHKMRLRVKPGITGLWQVSARSNVSFNDMVVLDLYYIENLSPWLDFQILLKTIPAVLSGKGAM